MEALQKKYLGNGLILEQLDDCYSPSVRLISKGEFVLYAEQDPNLYDEEIWWETSPDLTKENILEALLRNARKINSEEMITSDEGFLRMGYSFRHTIETMGKEVEKPIDLEYPLTKEGIIRVQENPLFQRCSYIMATQKIESKYRDENRLRICGRVYFGMDTKCGGIWKPGDLFLAHCYWNLKIENISPMISDIFKETSKFSQLSIGEGLRQLL